MTYIICTGIYFACMFQVPEVDPGSHCNELSFSKQECSYISTRNTFQVNCADGMRVELPKSSCTLTTLPAKYIKGGAR